MSKTTVKVDRDAMLDLLSIAYRACRQLGQISAAISRCADGQLQVDHGWLSEIAHSLDVVGHKAMIDAAELLGVDNEDRLARFRDYAEMDADAVAAVITCGSRPRKRAVA